jgi:hypothetical protein
LTSPRANILVWFMVYSFAIPDAVPEAGDVPPLGALERERFEDEPGRRVVDAVDERLGVDLVERALPRQAAHHRPCG